MHMYQCIKSSLETTSLKMVIHVNLKNVHQSFGTIFQIHGNFVHFSGYYLFYVPEKVNTVNEI